MYWFILSISVTFCHILVRYNVRYGRVDANDKEVEDAAAAADIHDRVLSFTDSTYKACSIILNQYNYFRSVCIILDHM